MQKYDTIKEYVQKKKKKEMNIFCITSLKILTCFKEGEKPQLIR